MGDNEIMEIWAQQPESKYNEDIKTADEVCAFYKMVQNGINITFDDCVKYNRPSDFDLLIDLISPLNIALYDNNGRTLLYRASVENLNIDLTRLILENMSDINIDNIDDDGKTVLDKLTEMFVLTTDEGVEFYDKLDKLIELLVDTGADPLVTRMRGAFAMAMMYNYSELVEMFLFSVGMPFWLSDEEGSLLMFLVRHAKAVVVSLYIERGYPSVHSINSRNETALSIANQRGNREIIGILNSQISLRAPVRKKIEKSKKSFLPLGMTETKWMSWCRSYGDRNIEDIRNLARQVGVSVDGKTKRQLCKDLAHHMEHPDTFDNGCANPVTLMQENTNELHPGQIVRDDHNNCYNLEDLELIQDKNPYTRGELNLILDGIPISKTDAIERLKERGVRDVDIHELHPIKVDKEIEMATKTVDILNRVYVYNYDGKLVVDPHNVYYLTVGNLIESDAHTRENVRNILEKYNSTLDFYSNVEMFNTIISLIEKLVAYGDRKLLDEVKESLIDVFS